MILNDQADYNWQYSGVRTLGTREISIHSASLKGKRERNEDSLGWGETEDRSLFFIMCDGLGGHAYGELASKEVVEELGKFLSELNLDEEGWSEEKLLLYLEDCIKHCGLLLRSHQDGRDTTLVLGLLTNYKLYLINIGDSLAEALVTLSPDNIVSHRPEVQGSGNRVFCTIEQLWMDDPMPAVWHKIQYNPTDGLQFILATDGVAGIFNQWTKTTGALELCRKACIDDTDNASCIIVKVNKLPNS